MKSATISHMRVFVKKAIIAVLTWEATLALKRHKPFIIAVTGSVGKTSTKDAIFHVLEKTGGIRKSEKSFNTEFGIPLSILALPTSWDNALGWMSVMLRGFARACFDNEYPKTLVLEVGADHPGDIKQVTKWLKPDIAVITQLPDRPVHMQYFASAEDVRKEKAELFHALRKEGTFVGCADDQHVTRLAWGREHTLFYGFDLDATVRGEALSTNYVESGKQQIPAGITFSVAYLGEKERITLPGVLGMQSAYAALAAIAVGIARGIPLKELASSLTTLHFPPGRMRIVSGMNGSTVIDDSYNSSPIAATAALETLRELHGGRKIAALGDMRELGEVEEEEHRKIGRLAGAFVDELVVVGKRAHWIADEARKAGLPEVRTHEFASSSEAGEWLSGALRAGDIVLCKGSQGSGEEMIRMERAVKRIMRDTKDASSLLVRQEDEWQKR